MAAPARFPSPRFFFFPPPSRRLFPEGPPSFLVRRPPPKPAQPSFPFSFLRWPVHFPPPQCKRFALFFSPKANPLFLPCYFILPSFPAKHAGPLSTRKKKTSRRILLPSPWSSSAPPLLLQAGFFPSLFQKCTSLRKLSPDKRLLFRIVRFLSMGFSFPQ